MKKKAGGILADKKGLAKQIHDLQHEITVHKKYADDYSRIFNYPGRNASLRVLTDQNDLFILYDDIWDDFQVFLQNLAVKRINQVHVLEKKLSDLVRSKFPEQAAEKILARDFKRSRTAKGK